MPATVTLDGYPELTYSGRVSAISAIAQESNSQSLRRAFEVIVALDRLDRERMRPGLSARAIVHRGETKAALVAPRSAIDFGGKSPRLRLADSGTKEVRLGDCNAQECVIVAGAEEGMRLTSPLEVRRE